MATDNPKPVEAPVPAAPGSQGRERTTDWQPIATAPKDGTNVLLVNLRGLIATALWQDGQWVLRGGVVSSFFNRHWPTHWMPLPSPPSGSAPDPVDATAAPLPVAVTSALWFGVLNEQEKWAEYLRVCGLNAEAAPETTTPPASTRAERYACLLLSGHDGPHRFERWMGGTSFDASWCLAETDALVAPLPQAGESRPCTCHPSERPAVCQHKYALSECLAAVASPRATGSETLDIHDPSCQTCGAIMCGHEGGKLPDEADVPLWLRRQLMEAARDKGISYYWLTAIYRKGFQDGQAAQR